MKSLLRLWPYLQRYRRTLLWGILTVVLSNLFTVLQPRLIGNAIDKLKVGLETHQMDKTGLLMYAGLVVALSLIAGFFTFLTRQTIIVVSRHIEFDLLEYAHRDEGAESVNERLETGASQAGRHADHVLLGDTRIDVLTRASLAELVEERVAMVARQ